jgi:MFS family permease
MHELFRPSDRSLWRMRHCHNCELCSVFCTQSWRYVNIISVPYKSIHRNFRSAFIAGRALVGIGQGFVLPCGPTFISETAPADIRGKIMSMWQGMLESSAFVTSCDSYSSCLVLFTIGSFTVYWISYGTNKSTAHLGLWRFRIVLICQCFLPMVICVGIVSISWSIIR